jgi:hypothetical protein
VEAHFIQWTERIKKRIEDAALLPLKMDPGIAILEAEEAS